MKTCALSEAEVRQKWGRRMGFDHADRDTIRGIKATLEELQASISTYEFTFKIMQWGLMYYWWFAADPEQPPCQCNATAA